MANVKISDFNCLGWNLFDLQKKCEWFFSEVVTKFEDTLNSHPSFQEVKTYIQYFQSTIIIKVPVPIYRET